VTLVYTEFELQISLSKSSTTIEEMRTFSEKGQSRRARVREILSNRGLDNVVKSLDSIHSKVKALILDIIAFAMKNMICSKTIL